MIYFTLLLFIIMLKIFESFQIYVCTERIT